MRGEGARLSAILFSFVLTGPVVAQQLEWTARQHVPPLAGQFLAASLADLDRDGDLDLITNGGNPALVRFFRNDGSGRFVPFPGAAALAPQSVHLIGDFDGDGGTDVAVRGAVLYNRGPAGPQIVNSNVTDTPWLVGDLNGDGRSDILALSGSGLATTIVVEWQASSSGTFTPIVLFTLQGEVPNMGAIADLDGDGDLDILSGSSSEFGGHGQLRTGFERIFRNDGANVFTEMPSWMPAAADDVTAQVVAADFDGDGFLDCAMQSIAPSRNWSFRRNDGTGRQVPWTQPVVPALAPSNALQTPQLMADFNRDGLPDFVGTNSWWLNQGGGNFVELPLDGNPHGRCNAVGDVDRDGDLDLVYSGISAGGGAVRLLLDQGNRQYVDATEQPCRFEGGNVELGDLDGDGDIDLLAAGGPLYRNDGSGWFTATAFPGVATPYQGHRLIDFDGDGDLDVAYTDTLRSNLYIALNNGTGTFTINLATIVGNANLSTTWTILDADGDGDLDLAVGHSFFDLVLLRNDGQLTFTAIAGAFPTATSSLSELVAEDFDRDGDIDLLTTCFVCGGRPALRMFVNDGTGTFTDTPARVTFSNQLSPNGVIAFDPDGDGDLDLLIGNRSSTASRTLLRNDGTGNLVYDATALPQLPPTGTATVGDIDDDGDLDIVTNDMLYWRNNGQGRFNQVESSLVIGTFNAFRMADLDGDGDADLIAGDRLVRSRQWDLAAPYLARIGRDYTLKIGARSMPNGFAAPFFASVRTQQPVPPFGTLGIDPAAAVALPLVPLTNGFGELVVNIPFVPVLYGSSFGVQAVCSDGTRLHLTPPVYDTIVR